MKTTQAGALLFAIITAFVLTLVASTLVVLTTNQYKIIDSEVDRIRAFYRAQAGMELAIYNLYSNTATWVPGTPDYTPDHAVDIENPVDINIIAGGPSSYTINVDTDY